MKTAVQVNKIEFLPATPVRHGAAFPEYSTRIRHEIATRAYEIYESRGKAHGHDVEDWLQAEAEILEPLHVTVHETERLYSLTAAVPEYGADELDLYVEPLRVVITGKRNHPAQAISKKQVPHSLVD